MEDRDIYRRWVKCEGLATFTVTEKETDLQIHAASDLGRQALEAVREVREQIEGYVAEHAEFQMSLEPIDVFKAPPVVESMARAGKAAGVGPMAAVAGAVAEFVGRKLEQLSANVIVENGGDIYVKAERDTKIGLFSGDSPFSGKLALDISSNDTPMGVCTSSGTVGHSLSFGKADSVTVMCRSAATADAYATAFANLVKGPDDIESVIESARSALEVTGVLVVVGDKLGTWGNVKFAQ